MPVSGTESIPIFWNLSFNKGILKNFVSWCFVNYGQRKTVKILEKLQRIGFGYATKAGVSIGIDDLKIPPTKSLLLAESDQYIQSGLLSYQKSQLTGLERFQRIIETWHNTSESLKDDMITNFRKIDILNPVFMMAFSGARGNVSQVRQLVSMRGLMSDPQGKILDFPIRSNFREGLTLTEYVISCYGARKGVVDTALRTANAGYLTRRLVDVAQHVIVLKFDCGTKKGFYLTEMKRFNKTLYPLRQRLLGRVLAANIYKSSTERKMDSSFIKSNLEMKFKQKDSIFSDKEIIAFRNEEISAPLAEKISKVTNKVFIRSPLTCQTPRLVCQLCYGWSLSEGYLVAIGEAVGVIAAQSIGEPGTQLTMRTFHTGGVFSGEMFDQLISTYNGFVYYPNSIPGTLIRTTQGKIAFLTKIEGKLSICETKNDPKDSDVRRNLILSNPSLRRDPITSTSPKSQVFKLPAYTVLFVRNNEKIIKDQLIAELAFISPTMQKTGEIAEFVVKSEMEGQLCSGEVNILEKYTDYNDIMTKSIDWGLVWILSGKICQLPINSSFFAFPGDLVDKYSTLSQIKWNVPIRSVVDTNLLLNGFERKLFSHKKGFSKRTQRISSLVEPSLQKKWLKKKALNTLNSFLKDKFKLRLPLQKLDQREYFAFSKQNVFSEKLKMQYRNPRSIFSLSDKNISLADGERKWEKKKPSEYIYSNRDGFFFSHFLHFVPKKFFLKNFHEIIIPKAGRIDFNGKIPSNFIRTRIARKIRGELSFFYEIQKKENYTQSERNDFPSSSFKKIFLTKAALKKPIGSFRNSSANSLVKKDKIRINFPLMCIPIDHVCYKKIGYFFLFGIKNTMHFQNMNNLKTRQMFIEWYTKKQTNTQKINLIRRIFLTTQSVSYTPSFFCFKNSLFNKISQKQSQNLFFKKNNLKWKKNVIKENSSHLLDLKFQTLNDVFFIPNFLDLNNLSFLNSRIVQKNQLLKHPFNYEATDSSTQMTLSKAVAHWFPKMYLTETGGNYLYLLTYDFFSHFGKKTYCIHSNLISRILWVNSSGMFNHSSAKQNNFTKDKLRFSLVEYSVLKNQTFLGYSEKTKNSSFKLKKLNQTLNTKKETNRYEERSYFQRSESLNYIEIKNSKRKLFASWFLPLLRNIEKKEKNTKTKYFYINLKHYTFKKLIRQYKSLGLSYKLYKKWFTLPHKKGRVGINMESKLRLPPYIASETRPIFNLEDFKVTSNKKDFKTGWIYKPKNLVSAISFHKKFVFPGQKMMDDLVFDNYPIYIECIQEMVFEKMNHTKTLVHKIRDTFESHLNPLDHMSGMSEKNLGKAPFGRFIKNGFIIKKLVKTSIHIKNSFQKREKSFPQVGFKKDASKKSRRRGASESFGSKNFSLLSFSKLFSVYFNFHYAWKPKSSVKMLKMKSMNILFNSFILVIKPVTEYPLYKHNFYKKILYKLQKRSETYFFQYCWNAKSPIFSKIFKQNYHSIVLNKQKQSLKLLDTFPSMDLFLKLKWKGSNKDSISLSKRKVTLFSNRALEKTSQKVGVVRKNIPKSRSRRKEGFEEYNPFEFSESYQREDTLSDVKQDFFQRGLKVGRIKRKSLNIAPKNFLESIFLGSSSSLNGFFKKTSQTKVFKQTTKIKKVSHVKNFGLKNYPDHSPFLERMNLKKFLYMTFETKKPLQLVELILVSVQKTLFNSNKIDMSQIFKIKAQKTQILSCFTFFPKKKEETFLLKKRYDSSEKKIHHFSVDTQSLVNENWKVVTVYFGSQPSYQDLTKVPFYFEQIWQALNSTLVKNRWQALSFKLLTNKLKKSSKLSNLNTSIQNPRFYQSNFKPNFYFNYYQKYPSIYFFKSHLNSTVAFFSIFQNSKGSRRSSKEKRSFSFGKEGFAEYNSFQFSPSQRENTSSSENKFFMKQINFISFLSTFFQQPCLDIFLTKQISFGYNEFQSFQFSKSTYNLQMKGLFAKIYFNNSFNNKEIALTRYLSPFFGEILRHDNSYWLQNTQRNRYLLLTKKDQISFFLKSYFKESDGRISYSALPEKSKSIIISLEESVLQKRKTYVGKLVARGDSFNVNHKTFGSSSESGMVIHFNKSKITLRKAQSFLLSPNCIFHFSHGDLVEKNKALLSLPYKQLKTGDIVQGIPKVEQLLEARSTFKGKEEEDNLHKLLAFVFERYKTKFSLKIAVRKSLSFIQLILVNSVQRIYRSQGVNISDKHLEVIVKQMTSKVFITSRGDSSFFRGEYVDLYIVEMWNSLHPNLKKITYKPILLGISRSSLEVNSFLSAASFQHTKKVLSRSAFKTNIDFLNGLKENVIIGNLISAGTGNVTVKLI